MPYFEIYKCVIHFTSREHDTKHTFYEEFDNYIKCFMHFSTFHNIFQIIHEFQGRRRLPAGIRYPIPLYNNLCILYETQLFIAIECRPAGSLFQQLSDRKAVDDTLSAIRRCCCCIKVLDRYKQFL